MEKGRRVEIGVVLGMFLLAPVTFGEDPDVAVVADFNQGQPTNNLGQKIEIWLKDLGDDPSQVCRLSFVADDALGASHGQALRLDYDVDSPNPAYNGMRTDLNGFNATEYKTLNFYIKGDSQKGFGKRLKIELIGPNKVPSPFIVEGITDQWQKVTVPLADFWGIQDWTSLEKFVVVFADIVSDPKTGALYLDHVHFSK